MRTISEFSEAELLGELDRRKNLRAQGRCDFCGVDYDGPTCLFPERHAASKPEPEAPVAKLVWWLEARKHTLEQVAKLLKLTLPACEGHRQTCPDGIVLWPTPAMTAYTWDGQGEDPNRPRLLCLQCSTEYVEDWQERWDEYQAGQL
jgi:hypothetical protein